MGRIEDVFAAQRAEDRRGLMPFLTAGYPSAEATVETLAALEKVPGVGVVELGFPFSDPIADGPVIAASMHAALAAGITPLDVFGMVREARRSCGLGLVAMVSDSIVERMGRQRFVDEAAEAGFDGLIVPDLDADAGSGPRLDELAARRGLAFSMLVAPTTPSRRLASLVGRCRGFVYVLARVGITGERRELPDVAGRVAAIRRHTDLPVAVGFGISTPEQVAGATEAADAAIVGSALVRRMGEADDPAAAAAEFARTLAAGLRLPTRSGPAGR